MIDTIFALSSGRPPAAIGVVRISGPAAVATAATLTRTLPPPRTAGLRRLRDQDGSALDDALVLVFPGPTSATGEDLVEFHLHGGRAVVAAVERALAGAGLRRAEPGEFTRRALANGRIDLAEAEGLGDLLQAETEAQRRVALASAEGALSRAVREWLDRVLALSAAVEAQLDFSDEDDDASGDQLGAIRDGAAALRHDIDAMLARPKVDRLRDGIRVVLAGPPNSGKSTLLNALAERDVAIVSPIAGTTRDRIEAPVTRAGIPFVLTDTAGLTETDDPIEAIGVDLATRAVASADLVLWLGDGAAPPGSSIAVHARADLPDRADVPQGRVAVSRGDPGSIARLWTLLVAAAREVLPGDDAPALNQRQHGLCAEAAGALTEIEQQDDWLVVAEALRRARTSLARILGQDATEVMLDGLFGRFCIGK